MRLCIIYVCKCLINHAHYDRHFFFNIFRKIPPFVDCWPYNTRSYFHFKTWVQAHNNIIWNITNSLLKKLPKINDLLLIPIPNKKICKIDQRIYISFFTSDHILRSHSYSIFRHCLTLPILC